MITNTAYTSWARVDGYSATVEGSADEWLAEFSSEYDLETLVDAYRKAINDVLPEGFSLLGNDFYGPYYASADQLHGYPTDEYGSLDFREIVQSVDFWQIAVRHEIGMQG